MTVLILDRLNSSATSPSDSTGIDRELDLLYLAVDFKQGCDRLDALQQNGLMKAVAVLRDQVQARLRIRCTEGFPRTTPCPDLNAARQSRVAQALAEFGLDAGRFEFSPPEQILTPRPSLSSASQSNDGNQLVFA